MKLGRFLRLFGVCALALLLGLWTKGFWIDGRPELGAFAFPERMTLEEVARTWDESVAPILRQKCAQCHTDTRERPFVLYHVPLVAGLFGRQHVDTEIRKGRVRFDFSTGFPTGRLGASLEHIQALRESVVEGSMPPLAYALARPHTFLNEREVEVLLDWSQKSAHAVWRALPAASRATRLDDADLERLAWALVRACPLAEPDDLEAQLACARALVRLDLLRDGMSDPIFWGQQQEQGEYRFSHAHSTRFSPRVWRTLYASLFMFQPGHRIERAGDLTVLRLPVAFRRDLDAGDYPYPFWHEPAKWDAYVRSPELLLVVEQGRIIGAMRSAEMLGPPAQIRSWDERWTWEGEGGTPEPEPARLYTRIFSAGNPHVDELDASYRALALSLRDADCMECHSPDNQGGMKMLEILNYPNHALAARNRLVTALRDNTMPPVDGIPDEARRRELLDLALAFRAAADRALSHDEGRVEDLLDRPLDASGI